MPEPRAHPARDQSLADQKNPQRPEHEHHERVAEQPVAEPAPPRPGAVLVDGQGLDVADAPPVEVAGRRVVDGVLVAPPREGRVEDDAEHGAERCVRALRAQERAVRAVVEDDEGADQESGRGNRQREHEEIRDPEGREHRRHQRQIGDDGRRHVEQRRSQSRSHVGRENRAPGFVRGWSTVRAHARACRVQRGRRSERRHATDDGCLENVMKRPFPRGVGRWTAPLSKGW